MKVEKKMEFKDESNQPRFDEDLKRALEQVENSIIRFDRVSPELVVHLPCIREALMELLEKRRTESEVELLKEYTDYIARSRDDEFEPLEYDSWKETNYSSL